MSKFFKIFSFLSLLLIIFTLNSCHELRNKDDISIDYDNIPHEPNTPPTPWDPPIYPDPRMVVPVSQNQTQNTPPQTQSVEATKIFEEQAISTPIDKEAPSVKQTEIGIFENFKKKMPIALFVPLSGADKYIGENMLNSAILSLKENDPDSNIEIFPFDSTNIKESFKKIVDQNIKIVIGPIFSADIKQIAADAKKNNMIIFSFSNNIKLNQVTDESGIFTFGIPPEAQIERIVSYLIKNKVRNFSVISSTDSYGMYLTEIYKKYVTNKDGRFITSGIYSNQNDMEYTVKKVINSYKIPAEYAEGGGNKINKIQNSKKQFTEAIFVTESDTRNIAKIAELISKNNSFDRKVKIAYQNDIFNEDSLENQDLEGAIFASFNIEKYKKFKDDYIKLYNSSPSKISIIAYDIVAFLSKISEKKGNNLTLEELINISEYSDEKADINKIGFAKKGFNGISGLFRILPNGLVERKLGVFAIENNSFITKNQHNQEFLNY